MNDKDKKKAFADALAADSPDNVEQMNLELKADNLQFELDRARKSNKNLRNAIKIEKETLQTFLALKKISQIPKIVVPKMTGDKPLATAVALFGDAHMEEQVQSERVNGLNFYDLEEAKKRVELYLFDL